MALVSATLVPIVKYLNRILAFSVCFFKLISCGDLDFLTSPLRTQPEKGSANRPSASLTSTTTDTRRDAVIYFGNTVCSPSSPQIGKIIIIRGITDARTHIPLGTMYSFVELPTIWDGGMNWTISFLEWQDYFVGPTVRLLCESLNRQFGNSKQNTVVPIVVKQSKVVSRMLHKAVGALQASRLSLNSFLTLRMTSVKCVANQLFSTTTIEDCAYIRKHRYVHAAIFSSGRRSSAIRKINCARGASFVFERVARGFPAVGRSLRQLSWRSFRSYHLLQGSACTVLRMTWFPVNDVKIDL